jgi:hypothetical protein
VNDVECDNCGRTVNIEIAEQEEWTMAGVAGYYDFCPPCAVLDDEGLLEL